MVLLVLVAGASGSDGRMLAYATACDMETSEETGKVQSYRVTREDMAESMSIRGRGLMHLRFLFFGHGYTDSIPLAGVLDR